MPILMEHERDNVFRVVVRGTLGKAEFDGCQDRLAGEIARIGSVRLLFVLDGFEGWQSTGQWNDLSFYAAHGDKIERIAIVGPPRWQDETFMFAAAGLRKAPVQFFPTGNISQARDWLSSQNPEPKK